MTSLNPHMLVLAAAGCAPEAQRRLQSDRAWSVKSTKANGFYQVSPFGLDCIEGTQLPGGPPR